MRSVAVRLRFPGVKRFRAPQGISVSFAEESENCASLFLEQWQRHVSNLKAKRRTGPEMNHHSYKVAAFSLLFSGTGSVSLFAPLHRGDFAAGLSQFDQPPSSRESAPRGAHE